MSDCANGGRNVPLYPCGGTRILRRYDPATREHRAFSVPASRRASCYEADMDVEVDCASCGRPMRFGDTYTSLEIQTPNGFGYGVCGTCYDMEMKRRRAAGRG